ncbi:MAG TPA: NADH-quinone oxidoreductase subunit NuoE [Candidatus Azoamicus sp. OHIO2]
MLIKLENFVSKDIIDRCDNWIKKYPKDQKRSAVIELLKIVQQSNNGYLNEQLINSVADYLSIPAIYAYEVVTFYSMFDMEETGRYKIYFCVSISCMLCGADSMLDFIKKKLNIQVNETTYDKKFTLKKAECLAACGGAPVMLIGEKYYENLTVDKINYILDSLE